eukprot:jgi/Tetstr1/431964/TSEL_021441.t1
MMLPTSQLPIAPPLEAHKRLPRPRAFASVTAARRVHGKPSFWQEAAASAIGGSLHAIIEQPLACPIEASITQTQVNGLGFIRNFQDLLAKGMLYRSLPTALLGSVPKAVIHYSILNIYINNLAPAGDMKNADSRTATLIGMATGATEVLLTNPLNFVKFRMQRPEWGYAGMMDAVKTIYRDEGLGAFWKGTGPTFLRNAICNGGMVGGYKLAEKMLDESGLNIPDGPRHFLAGAIGGVVGSFCSYPMEMLRAAQQHNISFMDEIVLQGPKRMLAGWAPGAARLVMTAAIMGSIIPHLKAFSNSLVMGGQEEEGNADGKKSKSKLK